MPKLNRTFRAPAAPSPRPPAFVETIEPRLLFAVFTVINTLDSGAGSLRRAIDDANTAGGADQILFDIPGAGPHSIALASPLPPVLEEVDIDATSQPGWAADGPPLVELNGASAGANADGLTVNADNVFVQGLVINRFSRHGIAINGNGAFLVFLNVGTSPTSTDMTLTTRPGLTARPNGGDGVRIAGNDNAMFNSVVAFNGGAGLAVTSGVGNDIALNSIFQNGGQAIDLGADGVTANDAGDADGGPNGLLNFPVITGATSDGTDTTVTGTINTLPDTEVFISIYASPTGEREGRVLLTPVAISLDDITTDANGNGTFTAVFPTAVAAGHITAAAAVVAPTSPLGFLDTSEFAEPVAVAGTATPHVTGVFASGGAAWVAAFRDFLQARGLGSSAHGYRIADGGPGSDELPWTNLTTLTVTFDADVSPAAADDVVVRDAATLAPFALAASNPVTMVDARTLRVTLAQPLPATRAELVLDGDPGGVTAAAGGRLLDGEFTNFLPSGDGSPGGDFAFRFNVLPGDVDRNRAVNIFDTLAVRNRQGTSTASQGTPPNTYTAFHDVDGNAAINIFDTLAVRNRQGTSLPAVVAPAPTFAAGLFGSAPIAGGAEEDEAVALLA